MEPGKRLRLKFPDLDAFCHGAASGFAGPVVPLPNGEFRRSDRPVRASGGVPIEFSNRPLHRRDMRDDNAVELKTARPGAHLESGGVRYRVWAPDHERVLAHIQRPGAAERNLELQPQGEGFFEAFDEQGRAGDLYFFGCENGQRFPDPLSLFQPKGVHGPSEVIDSAAYHWRTESWRRPAWRGQTIYELHVGTFTEDGTFLSAIERLDHIVELGAEAIEIMPVADFAGDRNWGYDGVCLYAPARCYGRPDDLRALVDAAHQRGLAVILDVVYNHLGPAGNYLSKYANAYFHPSRHTPWGAAFNLDTPESRAVREFFLANAVYWLDEYRIDGLRLDATHTIEDASETHLLAEITQAAHERGAFVIAEDERNSTELLTMEDGRGHGMDAVWSDDFHHQVRVALTGVSESYFASYAGSADTIASTLQKGWFYTGEAYPFWKGRTRGSASLHLPPKAFVYCIENHDQVGNRALGERLEHLIEPAMFRAATMLVLLSPYAPMLFMGQEWAASAPFFFFTNHGGDLGKAISVGRRKEFAQAGLNANVAPEQIPDPEELMTFVRSKLDWSEVAAPQHAQMFAFSRECLRVRKTWIHGFTENREQWSATVAGPAVVIRYELAPDRAALLIVALRGGAIESIDEFPFLAPRSGRRWRAELQTEDPHFGGAGQIGGAVMHASGPVRPWLNFARPGAVFLIEETL